MCDTSAISHLDGDVVWVKIGNCWWPGEVCGESRLPEGLLSSIKKQPIAVVKFFQENTYEYVKSIGNISPYNCPRKHEWIKRGLELYRAKNRYMDKFPADVITAEEITNGDPKILTRDEFVPNRKPNYANIFGDPSKSVKKTKSQIGKKLNSPLNITKRSPHTKVIKNVIVSSPRIPSTSNIGAISKDSPGSYQCHLCDFTSNRLNVIILHTKNHKNDPKPTTIQSSSSSSPKSKKSIKTPSTVTTTAPISNISEKTTPEKNKLETSILVDSVRKNKRKRLSSKISPSTTTIITEEIVKNKSVSETTKTQNQDDEFQPSKKSKTENQLTSELLADWSEDESENEIVSNAAVSSVSSKQSKDAQSSIGSSQEPIRLDNEMVQLIKTVDSNDDIHGIAEISDNSNLPDKNQSMPKYRNIPKKDRRDVVLKEFSNGDIVTASQSNSLSSNKNPLDEEITETTVIEINSDIDNPIEAIRQTEEQQQQQMSVDEIIVEEIMEILPANDNEIKKTNDNDGNVSNGDGGDNVKEDAQKSSISCFDFKEDEEDEDFLTSLSRLKKKYMSPEKSKEQSLENKPILDVQEFDRHDDQLTSEIENLLNTTKPPELKVIDTIVTDIKLSPTSSDTVIPTIPKEVRALPPKERGKRIFKSRNRSRYDELINSDEKKIESSPRVDRKSSKASINEEDSQQLTTSIDITQDEGKETKQNISDKLEIIEKNIEIITEKQTTDNLVSENENTNNLVSESEIEKEKNSFNNEIITEIKDNTNTKHFIEPNSTVDEKEISNLTDNHEKIDVNEIVRIEDVSSSIVESKELQKPDEIVVNKDVDMENLSIEKLPSNQSEKIEEINLNDLPIEKDVVDKVNELTAIAETLISIPNKLTEMVTKSTTNELIQSKEIDDTKIIDTVEMTLTDQLLGKDSNEKDTTNELKIKDEIISFSESLPSVDKTNDMNTGENDLINKNEEIIMEIVCSNNSNKSEIADNLINIEESPGENDQNKNSINTTCLNESKDINNSENVQKITTTSPIIENEKSIVTSTRRRRAHMKITPRKRLVQPSLKLFQLSDNISTITDNKEIDLINPDTIINPIKLITTETTDLPSSSSSSLIKDDNNDNNNDNDSKIIETIENKDKIDDDEEIQSPEYKIIESKDIKNQIDAKIKNETTKSIDIVENIKSNKLKLLKDHVDLIEKQLHKKKDEIKHNENDGQQKEDQLEMATKNDNLISEQIPIDVVMPNEIDQTQETKTSIPEKILDSSKKDDVNVKDIQVEEIISTKSTLNIISIDNIENNQLISKLDNEKVLLENDNKEITNQTISNNSKSKISTTEEQQKHRKSSKFGGNEINKINEEEQNSRKINDDIDDKIKITKSKTIIFPQLDDIEKKNREKLLLTNPYKKNLGKIPNSTIVGNSSSSDNIITPLRTTKLVDDKKLKLKSIVSSSSTSTSTSSTSNKSTIVSPNKSNIFTIGQNKFEARTPKKRKQTFEDDIPSFIIEKNNPGGSTGVSKDKLIGLASELLLEQPPEKLMKLEKDTSTIIIPQKIKQQKIIISDKTSTSSSSINENIFDINNMPILLANESILTEENLDKMQIVIAEENTSEDTSSTTGNMSQTDVEFTSKSLLNSPVSGSGSIVAAAITPLLSTKSNIKLKKNTNQQMIIQQSKPSTSSVVQQQQQPSSSTSSSLNDEGKQIGVDGKGNKFVIIKSGNSAKMIIQPDTSKITTTTTTTHEKDIKQQHSTTGKDRITNVISSQTILSSGSVVAGGSNSNSFLTKMTAGSSGPRGRLISSSSGCKLVITSKGNVIPSNSSAVTSKCSGITITSTSTITHGQDLVSSSPQVSSLSSSSSSSSTSNLTMPSVTKQQRLIKQQTTTGHGQITKLINPQIQTEEHLLNKKITIQKSHKSINLNQQTVEANRRIQMPQNQINEMTRLGFKEEKPNESGTIIISSRGVRPIHKLSPSSQQQQQQVQSQSPTKIVRKSKIKMESEQLIHKNVVVSGNNEIPPLAPITDSQITSPQQHQQMKQIKKKIPTHSKDKLITSSPSSSSSSSSSSGSSSVTSSPLSTTTTSSSGSPQTTTAVVSTSPKQQQQIENTQTAAVTTVTAGPTIEQSSPSPPDLSSKYGDGNLLAVPGETFGGPANSFFLCTIADNDCGFVPIDNQPLYLDASNQLVPMLPDTETIIQESLNSTTESATGELQTGDTTIIEEPQIAVEITESGEQVLTDLSQITDGSNQTFLINTVDGHQILLDQQSLLALVASGNDGAQVETADGQQFTIPPELLQAIGVSQNNEIAGQILLSETLDGQIQTQNHDILAAALAGTEVYNPHHHHSEQLIGDVLQIETTGDNASTGNVQIVEQGLTFQTINQTITAQTNETNAILTQPPIMSALEVPSTTNSKKFDIIGGTAGSNNSISKRRGGILQNLDDSLAVIGVNTQSLSTVPSSLELPITVTNPAIAAQPKTTPISLTGIYSTQSITTSTTSQISPTLSTIDNNNTTTQDINYDIFTSTVVLQENNNNLNINNSNNCNNSVSNKTNNFNTNNHNVNRIGIGITTAAATTATSTIQPSATTTPGTMLRNQIECSRIDNIQQIPRRDEVVIDEMDNIIEYSQDDDIDESNNIIITSNDDDNNIIETDQIEQFTVAAAPGSHHEQNDNVNTDNNDDDPAR